MAVESLVCCRAVHGVRGPGGYYVEILVFHFASFPDLSVRQEQLQRYRPPCLLCWLLPSDAASTLLRTLGFSLMFGRDAKT